MPCSGRGLALLPHCALARGPGSGQKRVGREPPPALVLPWVSLVAWLLGAQLVAENLTHC